MIVGAGLVALAIIAWYLWKGLKRQPVILRRYGRQVLGALALAAALLMTMRGSITLGGIFAVIGMGLLSGDRWEELLQRFTGAPSQVIRMRTAHVEIEMNSRSGVMTGTVLTGEFAGRRFDELDRAALVNLARECTRTDPEGSHLLGVYLDRRFAGWRQHEKGDFDPGEGPRARPGVMSTQEANEILGLEPGATADQVRRAHRRLIKKMHPDQGGSTYLASRINEARDVLLRSHP